MLISLIVAVDDQLGLGRENALLCHLPADLQHFKAITMGKPIIMGRKTFDAIGRALPGRENIVLTRGELQVEGVITVHSLKEAIDRVSTRSEVMVIGGACVYEQAMPLAHRIYLTHIHGQLNADVFFPSIDSDVWTPSIIEERAADLKNAYAMTFYQYERAP